MSDDTMPDLTVEQRVRDSAVRERGVKLTAEEVAGLFERHPSIAKRAYFHDMNLVDWEGHEDEEGDDE